MIDDDGDDGDGDDDGDDDDDDGDDGDDGDDDVMCFLYLRALLIARLLFIIVGARLEL